MQSNQRWLILAIISSALCLIVIDMTVLYTALPSLTHALHASASEKLWIVNMYPLVVSGLLLGMGTLGDRLGHKRLFVSGLMVFGIASLCAAFAPTSAFLIAARALLAVGAAMMMPATLSIVRVTFTDPAERSLAIGIWAAVASGGAAFGPVLGGLLLEHFWWGSVFLINVPIVLIALCVAIPLIPARSGNKDQHWDLIGSMQVMIGLIGLAYAIKELGKQHPSWAAAVITCVIGTVFMTIFIRRQRRSLRPMLDLAIFKHAGFTAAVMTALISAATLIGMELVFTQRLQLVLGMSPLEAGLFILPLSLASFISGPVAGKMLPRVGSHNMLVWGLIISGIGMGSYLMLYDAHVLTQFVCLFVLGAGLGATMTSAASTIMLSAPEKQAGMAASIEEVSFELGGAIGVTLMGSIHSAVYTYTMLIPADIVTSTNISDSLDEALLAAETLPQNQSDIIVSLAQAAFDRGFTTVLLACTVLLLGAACAIHIKRKQARL
jgi:DHA2 family multidrug resistance protein-like MFS transporter